MNPVFVKSEVRIYQWITRVLEAKGYYFTDENTCMFDGQVVSNSVKFRVSASKTGIKELDTNVEADINILELLAYISN